jgi:truncated hemoglobin YjbI
MPFPIDRLARERWLHLMGNALAEAGLPADADAELRAFFDAASEMLINRGTDPRSLPIGPPR